jgi:hypothetical protein
MIWKEAVVTKSRYYTGIFMSWDSLIGIATSYGLDDREVGIRDAVRSRIFYSPERPDRLWVRSISYPMGTGGSFLVVKTAGA